MLSSIAPPTLTLEEGTQRAHIFHRAVWAIVPIAVAFLTGSGLYSRDAADVVGDATIRKPFTLEELISTVTRLARSERSATSPSH